VSTIFSQILFRLFDQSLPDDAHALLLAFASENDIFIEGLTIVFGNNAGELFLAEASWFGVPLSVIVAVAIVRELQTSSCWDRMRAH
jgi:hypothetical protein